MPSVRRQAKGFARFAVLGFISIMVLILVVRVGAPRRIDDNTTLRAENAVGSRMFPIIFAGEYLDIEPVPDLLGEPVFSGDRKIVNPAIPRFEIVEGNRRTYFEVPGEYYLQLEPDAKIRVLVLDPESEISENVIRTFDFLAANLISTQGHSASFASNHGKFLDRYFQTHKPVMLLCGETLSLFSMIVQQRFSLPVREVTFTGVWLDGGMVKYGTHNVLEIYLPDKEKWMLLDVNNGFAAKWMDAFELTDAIRSAASSRAQITSEEFASVPFNVHYEVDPKRPKNAADTRTEFSPEMLTNTSIREQWFGLGKVLFSGPGYWGGQRTGESMLPKKHDLYLSRYHSDEFLLQAQLRWQGNWNLDTVHVAPRRLKSMLDDAYKEEIAKKAWLTKIPAG